MKILYLECDMGIAGDMLMSALLQLMPDKEHAVKELNALGLPHTEIYLEEKSSCGISGACVKVMCKGHEEDEHHHGNGIHNIMYIINSLDISEAVKQKAIKTYEIIAEAESKVHGTEIDNIHFHEVGTLDAIADVVSCTYLIDALGVEKIICSPINTGSGTVKCAHGILPVPAPATAEILKGIPCYSNEINGELCTPTGAALVKANADEYGKMPEMMCSDIGYGFGKKEFEAANCVRAFLGEADCEVIELACNIDDMTAEDLAFACSIIMENGALDVTQSPITMKKSRLGTMLSVLCKAEDKEKMLELIFKHTTTIGVREYKLQRHTMKREINKINTPFGELRSKKSTGYGICKEKPEHDDIEKIARDNDISIEEVKRLISKQQKRH